jgi:hypothetical protein
LFVCIGQYNDDSRATQRIQQQQQQNGIESDDEDDDRSTMFQADYEYTPLKEYAAMRNNRTTNDNNTNSYQSKCFTFFFSTLKRKRNFQID